MRVSARSLLLAACLSLAAAEPALAGQNGLFLPAPPTGPGGEDSVETQGGTRCRQSMNGNGAYVDMGVVGTATSPPTGSNSGLGYFSDQRDREATAYARVTIPLGKRPQRLDCNRLYEIEIQRLQREVELLKMAAQ